ncbi:tRNA (adenosine(37)-N6)-threonylcarbamoyltransferase complex dimerization subunit type 1 TsaB [Spirochaetia bacterium]|nr:tRNA (adenosine(37)-N6)-threonylcarbamoyltransferase complex dimerization subunit type 1 TsaB [Spirochaetia bacterium]
MNILAIDTATNVLSVALSAGHSDGAPNTRWYIEADAGLRHSEILMDMVDTLLKQGGLEPADINLVSCMKGPGSFTGLRIGFSAAKGIALALKIPLIPVPTLDCMAYSYSVWPGIVIPAIDAKKGRFFSALYRDGIRITDEKDADAAAIAGLISDALASSPDGERSILITGPDAAMLHTELQKQFSGCPDAESLPGIRPDFIRLDPACRKGRAVELLELARKDAEPDIGEDNFFAGPEYLRKSDAELNT